MFKLLLSFGTIALLSATALGGQSTTVGDLHTITVQGGQGSAITISNPVTAQEIKAPYALTGQVPTDREPRWTTKQFGQGGLIWIAE